MTVRVNPENAGAAVLDEAHIGHIQGAFGTILQGDVAPRATWKHRLTTLLAILGPGLIVMAGDNDSGAFATYGQAGQNYGTTLLWTLTLLIPVLYVNQEMVLRLGAVTGVGHARLIFERFGKFWGAFSVIDLFLLNALTIITEFIGIALALNYLGLDKTTGVVVSAALIMIAVSTGNFRRFERFAMLLVFASLLLIPIFFMVHPPLAQVARDLAVPQIPAGKLSDVMLIIIGLVGTTVAPWQLFFQQSYVIDKRITPRFIRYERLDLWLGIALVIVGAAAIIAFTAATFAGRPEFGNFTDAGGIAAGLEKYVGTSAGVVFAIALIDASLLGASAVSLSTAYAIGDVFSARHSLHRKVTDAKGFYAVYFLLIAIAAAIVLTPGSPLGLLTVAVQVLAGVLLPSATVFLLLLCNDRPVLGPWVNPRWLNYFTGAVIAVLVLLSVILTVSVLFPDATNEQVILGILGGGGVIAVVAALVIMALSQSGGSAAPAEEPAATSMSRDEWRMPPLEQLPPAKLSLAAKTWMGVLRLYLVVAGGLLLFRIVSLAVGVHGGPVMTMQLAQAGLNLFIAACLGAAIGLERQWRQRLAGLRTNTLVALGAAIFVTYAHVVPDGLGDTRIAAQVVSGIGFLGAGVIFKEGLNVRGLNTAATLWCSAAVGLLAGEGLALYGLMAAALVLGANTAMRPIVHAINRQPIDSTEEERHYLVSIDCRAARASDIRSLVVKELAAAAPDLHFSEVDSAFVEDSDRVEVTATVTSHKRRELALEAIVARLSEADGVIRAGWREQTQSV